MFKPSFVLQYISFVPFFRITRFNSLLEMVAVVSGLQMRCKLIFSKKIWKS